MSLFIVWDKFIVMAQSKIHTFVEIYISISVLNCMWLRNTFVDHDADKAHTHTLRGARQRYVNCHAANSKS